MAPLGHWGQSSPMFVSQDNKTRYYSRMALSSVELLSLFTGTVKPWTPSTTSMGRCFALFSATLIPDQVGQQNIFVFNWFFHVLCLVKKGITGEESASTVSNSCSCCLNTSHYLGGRAF